MRRAVGVVLAIANLAAAGVLLRFGVISWRSGLIEENAGLGLMALVAFGIAAMVAGLSVVLWRVAKAVPRRGTWLLFVLGLPAPLLVFPLVVEEYQRSTTWLELKCSNLSRRDPLREVATHAGWYTFFGLLSPWVAHQPDTRYVLRDAAGQARTFRLQCIRNGPCVVRDGTEQELRDTVEELLPACPPPP